VHGLASASRFITVSSVLALVVLLGTWYGWLSPPLRAPVLPVLILLLAPLLIPLRGLLASRPYTYQWSIFLALAYFTHGVVETFGAPAERGYALLEIVLTLSWFLAAIVFVRTARNR
jgi:uncharacterized membrane protein